MFEEASGLETAGTELRSRITEAAMRCFCAKGYDEVSVNDICLEAGIARSTFYRAFPDKKGVIRTLFEYTDANSIVSVEELLAAQNDFDRMWIIGDRYISLCKKLGVPFVTALMKLSLDGEIDMLSLAHSVDKWFIRLTRNCQQSGIILSSEPPELLGPLFADTVYQILYAWCCRNGNYPVRARARQMTELMANVAPRYRWTTEQRANADG